jgi:hypothetical protein
MARALLTEIVLRAEGQGAKKKVCFAHKMLVFHFFFLLMVLHGVTFNVIIMI